MAAMSNVERASERTLQRLSTGSAINSAADNASGLSITDKMTAQIRGLGTALRNIQDGVSLASTAEGAMGSLTDMALRMRELVIESANGTNHASDRLTLDNEFQELKDRKSVV